MALYPTGLPGSEQGDQGAQLESKRRGSYISAPPLSSSRQSSAPAGHTGAAPTLSVVLWGSEHCQQVRAEQSDLLTFSFFPFLNKF